MFLLKTDASTSPIRSQYTVFLPPENIRKRYGSGGRERVHWEQMG